MKSPSIPNILKLSASVFASTTLPLLAQDDAQPDPYEWVVETYSFPAHELVQGFASEERGSLTAPKFPEGDLTEDGTIDFLRKSHSIVTHYLKKQGLALPEGTVVVFDPESLSLAARAPRITQQSIHFTSAAYRAGVPTFLELNTVLLEGEAATIRGQLALAGETPDHSGILQRLEAAVPAGTVSILKRNRIEARSGQRAKIDETREIVAPSNLAMAPDGMVLYDTESHREGTIWEMDPVVGGDEKMIDLNLSLRHHFAPSARRFVPFARTGEATLSSVALEPSTASATSQFTLANSTTKMVGVWKPQSVVGAPGAPDRLQAGFISADIVEVLPLPNLKLAEILTKHANAVAPIPEGRPVFDKVAEEIPEGMIVRRFRIPPTFLTNTADNRSGPADPFASMPAGGAVAEPTFTVRATAKDILASYGIPFPEGSSANFLPETSTLVVRNTPENISLVEAIVMSIRGGGQTGIGITAYFVEGSAETIRAAVAASRRLANHVGAWQSLAENPAIRHLGSYWVESRSGQRSQLKAVTEFHFPSGNGVETGPEKDEKEKPEDGQEPVGTLYGTFDVSEIGTSIEIDSVLGGDGNTIELNYAISYDYADPSTGAVPVAAGADGAIQLDGPTTQLHRATLSGISTVRDGMVRLVGFWRPEGTPRFEQQDLLQAVFMKVDILAADQSDE